jgi:competence protein ComEC
VIAGARTRPRAKIVATRAAALVLGLAWLPWTASPRALDVWALDVGSGTACVAHGPGIGTWIFDAGSRDRPDVAREALGPLLARLDPGAVSIALSHDDEDHHEALAWVIERYTVALHAGAFPSTLASRLAHDVPRIDLERGGLWLADPPGLPSVRLERGLAMPGNEGSRTLRITWGDAALVLGGDAEAEGLGAWLASTAPGPVDVLLWPHHGSETDGLGPLLEHLRPREVWISAGREPAVGPELERRGVRWRTTEREGVLHTTLTPPE